MQLDNQTACHPPKDNPMMQLITYAFGSFNVSSTGVVLIIAILSWFWIPKWRSYMNFIFLNLFLADILLNFCFMKKILGINLFSHSLSKFLRLLGRYVNFVYFCWLFLFSINIYMDSVHFKMNLSWKFVKSSVFAWGLPLILHILLRILKVEKNHKKHQTCYHSHILHSSLIIKLILEIILVAVNFCAYFVVIFILYKQRDRGTSSEYRKMFIVTRTFVLCIILWLLSAVLEACISKFNFENLSDVYSAYFIMYFMQNTYLKLYFLFSTSNCIRWRKYFVKLLRNHQNREDVEMVTVE